MRLSGWQVPIESLSASSLSMFISCPEQWRLRRIKKVPESMGIDRFVGLVDHQTHARNFRHKIEHNQDLEISKMNSIYFDNWIEASTVEGEPDWSDDEQQKTMDRGLKMMQTYHEIVSPTVQPIKVEEWFEEKLPGVPVPVVGVPDVEEPGRIIERKTTSTKVSKPKPKWLFQGSIYSLVLDKPVEYQVVTKQVTPQVVTAADAPALRLEGVRNDATILVIQQAVEMLNDCWVRYGPDRSWPLHGLMGDWTCNYCFAGPRYGKYCPAWKENM